MPFRSLSGTTGYLTVGLTAVKLTANWDLVAPTAQQRCPAHTIFIQQHPTNTGILYLLDRESGSGSTGVGVLSILPPPFSVSTDLTGLPWIAFTIPYAPGGLAASQYWLISNVTSQKAVVSVIQA